MRIGFRFERILGRSAEFDQKWHFDFFHFFEYRIDRIDLTYRSIVRSVVSIEGPREHEDNGYAAHYILLIKWISH